ncbi:DUF3857 domain-containing protein [Pedobacter puniceum]|uniref:DUF3857 domain-containing protein n=1 Tax=Pedobacter puniceum TaxID=2666136 RepID=A0A7K0FQZ7_9SPHI|nr:DUF3857 domain-containing protein [Pedobacter puniceum]MRX48428.1 DUF3857 domain-containing protein [Pedobacter puniceum]
MLKKLHKTCFYLTILSFCLSKQLSAQEQTLKVKFGKVEIEEFKQKPSGKDSLANAVMLFDIGDISFSINNNGRWVYKFSRHKRIKILSKDGYNYANFEIPIYKSSNLKEEISSVSVASYNIVGEKVIQNKVLKDEKFTDKYNSYWTINKYTLSNIQPGTIVEIKYEIISEDTYDLRSWYFQHEIPVLHSELTLAIPEYFQYKLNSQSLVNLDLVNNEVISQNHSGSITSSSDSYRSQSYNFMCNATKRTWVAKNIFAFKNEPFITTSDDYITKISFELQSTTFPNDIMRNYSSSWQKIVENLLELESFGELVKVNNSSKNIISGFINEADSTEIKMQKIYNYLKKSIKWNEKTSIYASHKSIKNIIDQKNGNCSDINLTLINLLNSANIKANPVLISTRSNGRHPGIPLISRFNYIIAAVDINNKRYFLDATNPNYFINCFYEDALNHKGLLVDLTSKEGTWIPIEPEKTSKTTITNIFTLNNDAQLTGSINLYKTNYEAFYAKTKLDRYSSKEDYIKDYTKNKSGLKVDDLKNQNSEIDGVFAETMAVTIDDLVEEAGNLLYFNPLLFERTKENPFKSDERLFPVDFATPKEENYKFIFNIPDGYSLEKLPTPILYKLEDNSALFSYTVIQNDKQILINSKILISGIVYPSERYFELKELFKNIVNKQSEPIVLKKL